MRKEDEDVGTLAPGKGVDRRTTGIARGGADDGRPLAPLLQRVIHQPRQQLHGDILEGECGAVEEFHDEAVWPGLDERRHRGMPESGVGIVDHAAKDVGGDLAVGEGREDRESDLLIALAAKGADFLLRQDRPLTGNVKPAVTGKAGQKSVTEAKGRGFSPR